MEMRKQGECIAFSGYVYTIFVPFLRGQGLFGYRSPFQKNLSTFPLIHCFNNSHAETRLPYFLDIVSGPLGSRIKCRIYGNTHNTCPKKKIIQVHTSYTCKTPLTNLLLRRRNFFGFLCKIGGSHILSQGIENFSKIASTTVIEEYFFSDLRSCCSPIGQLQNLPLPALLYPLQQSARAVRGSKRPVHTGIQHSCFRHRTGASRSACTKALYDARFPRGSDVIPRDAIF